VWLVQKRAVVVVAAAAAAVSADAAVAFVPVGVPLFGIDRE